MKPMTIQEIQVASSNSVALNPGGLAAILAGLEPGWYTAKGLYPRYVVWAENLGLKPKHPRALGVALSRFIGGDKARDFVRDARIYLLTEDHVSGKPVSPDPVG